MVTTDNYEEYLMMAADGELDDAGKAALQAFMSAHPELAAEAGIWQAVKLQPDACVMYADKETLLRREPKRIALGWKQYTLAAAAGIAAVLIMLPLFRGGRHDAGIAGITHRFQQPVVVQQPAVTAAQPSAPAITSTVKPISDKRAARVRPSVQPAVLQIARQEVFSPELVPVSKTVAVPVAAVALPEMNLHTMPEISVIPAPQPQQKGFQVQLAAANKPALDLVKERIGQAATIARSIKETALVVKLGGNNLNLNF